MSVNGVVVGSISPVTSVAGVALPAPAALVKVTFGATLGYTVGTYWTFSWSSGTGLFSAVTSPGIT